MQIRYATPADAADVLRIYGPLCSNSPVTFDVAPPSLSQVEQEIAQIMADFPWLVCECDGEFAGYCYCSRHRDRPAYQWAVTTSVYIDAKYHRRGVGKALYSKLFEIVKQQGYYTAYAGITVPNVASEALHAHIGFEKIGTYRNVGYKLGAWHDVNWWEYAIQPPKSQPVKPTPFSELYGR